MTSRNATPSLAADALDVGEQRLGDAALAGAGIDDERDDPDEPVLGLEPGHERERDEAQHLARLLRHEHLGAGSREPADPALEVARTGRIALVGQQGGEPLRVVLGRGPDRELGDVVHGAMVPVAGVRDARAACVSTITRCGPATGPPPTSTEPPSGPTRRRAERHAAGACVGRPGTEAGGRPRYSARGTLPVAGE